MVKGVSDAAVLEALLKQNKLFTRTDALLKTMGIRPRHFRKRLAALLAEESWQPGPDERPGVISELGRPSAQSRTIEVETVFEALCHAPDPRLQRLFGEFEITPARIRAAADPVNRSAFWRGSLYVLKDTLEVILTVVVFLIIIKEGFGELRLIPSESMVPTLQVGDRVLIEKVTRWWRPYQRGDVLVFYPPSTTLNYDPVSVVLRLTGFSGLFYGKEDNIDVAYIKRLIGLPGDTVDVRPGEGVYVNGELLDEPYVDEIAKSCTQMRPEPLCEPVTVPEDKLFVMGDNRNHSADSRYWGFEPKRRIIGRAVARAWPPSRLGLLPSAPYETDAEAPGK